MNKKKEFSIKEKQLKWLACDLDKTIANSSYPKFKLEKPIKGAKEALDKLTKQGWKIVIHTSRPWSDYDIIEKWLIKHQIPFRRIVCGKLFARFYFDDRGIGYRGNWKNTAREFRRLLRSYNNLIKRKKVGKRSSLK